MVEEVVEVLRARRLSFYECLQLVCSGLADDHERTVCYRICKEVDGG